MGEWEGWVGEWEGWVGRGRSHRERKTKREGVHVQLVHIPFIGEHTSVEWRH